MFALSFRHFALGLLAQRPMSGYDIKCFLNGLDWLIGSPSLGSVYPTLHALLRDNLVTVNVVRSGDKPPRKVYSVTESGQQVLHEWVNRPVEPDASLRAFLVRLMLSSSLSRADLFAFLHQRRSQVASRRAALEAVVGSHKTVELGQDLTFDFALTVAATEMAWLDRTLECLSQERDRSGRG